MIGDNKRQTGFQYEKAAGAYLQAKGYTILQYNYTCPAGEIDIIAKDEACLVFVEVKYRRRETSGLGAEAVDVRKQQKLSKCALFYITENRLPETDCRFDVVEIQGKDIVVYEDAFSYWGN